MSRVAYVCFNNPKFHYLHKAWVESIGAEFLESDYFSLSPVFFIKTLLSAWKNRKSYDCLAVVGGSGIVLSGLIKFFNPRAKIIYLNIDPLFYELESKGFLKKAFIKWLASKIDFVISNSNVVNNQVKRYFNGETKVVKPFVRYSASARNLSMKRFDNLVFLGRLSREKNVDVVLRAFDIIRQKDPASKLYIIGDGPLEKRLKKIAPDNIIFTGYLENPSQTLAKCGFMLQPSSFESFGLSVFEGILNGNIPIVSKTMGVSEYLPKYLVLDDISENALAGRVFALKAKGNYYLESLNKKLQEKVKTFTKEESIRQFKEAFYSFCNG